jgi:hypothetical protein
VNQPLALLGLALVAAAVIGVAWLMVGRQGELLAGLFRAQGLGWPRGVQEEDPPPSWQWSQRREIPDPMDDGLDFLASGSRGAAVSAVGRGAIRRRVRR